MISPYVEILTSIVQKLNVDSEVVEKHATHFVLIFFNYSASADLSIGIL